MTGVSAYPEHDKQANVIAKTQAASEFIEFLHSQGIELMTYREDLSETMPASLECPSPRRSLMERASCDPTPDDTPGKFIPHWKTHCKHWKDPGREATGTAVQGQCCRCRMTKTYEITGVRGWAAPGRSLVQLIADWTGVDLKKIAAEEQQMLTNACTAIHAQNARR